VGRRRVRLRAERPSVGPARRVAGPVRPRPRPVRAPTASRPPCSPTAVFGQLVDPYMLERSLSWAPTPYRRRPPGRFGRGRASWTVASGYASSGAPPPRATGRSTAGRRRGASCRTEPPGPSVRQDARCASVTSGSGTARCARPSRVRTVRSASPGGVPLGRDGDPADAFAQGQFDQFILRQLPCDRQAGEAG
jgi:hypothetical protein